MFRKTTALVCGLVTTALLAATTGSSTAAATSPSTDPTPGLPVYLALGDSYANGQSSVDPAANEYWATVADWRATGYVAQLHEDLVTDLKCLPGAKAAPQGCRALQSLNLARSAIAAMNGQPRIPGVTTTSLIEEQLPAATALLEARNQDQNPRNDVEVITVTVGGNDIFGPVLNACLGGVNASCYQTVNEVFDGFALRYSQILEQLRAAGGDQVQIVTMTYPNPLPYCYLAPVPNSEALGDLILEGVPLPGEGRDGFNGLIAQISAQHGARVADTFGALGPGDFVGGTDCLHPNLSGHTKVAARFAAALTP
jgi:lysophospholipase L1-like esterase